MASRLCRGLRAFRTPAFFSRRLVTVKECPDEVDELIWADISASKEVLVVALDDGHTIASYPSTDGGGMRRHNGQLLYIEGRDDSPEKGQLLALQDVAAAWA